MMLRSTKTLFLAIDLPLRTMKFPLTQASKFSTSLPNPINFDTTYPPHTQFKH